MTVPDPRHQSAGLTDGPTRAPARAMLKATGLTDADLSRPLVGDPVTVRPGELPVFWGCGITPQYSLLSARPEIAITHKPGCLLISDVRSSSDALDLPAVPRANFH